MDDAAEQHGETVFTRSGSALARSALTLRDMLRRGEISSRELVRAALEQAAATRDLGALISVNERLALDEADAADRRIAAAHGAKHRDAESQVTESLPPLLGLPTVHKDLVAVRGTITTHGSLAVPHLIATEDDPIAAAVRAAGAVSIGKTQVPEFGIAGYSENSVAPPARNPYDPDRTAGGSSGGTAAAIAAGVIPGAIASDAGGSIRIPAAACGLVGLKPGRGVVPADRAAHGIATGADGMAALDEAGAPRMGVSGPIARTALDAALFFDAIHPLGVDTARRPPGPQQPATAADAVRRVLDDSTRLRGLRVGVSLASPFEGWAEIRFDEAALAALDAAAAALTNASHSVEEAAFDYDAGYPEAFTTVWSSALTRIPLAAGAEGMLGELARMFLERARATPAGRLAESAAVLRAFAAGAARQWGEYDVVLTPALARAAPRIGEFWSLGPEGDYRLQCEWAPQTSMVNVAGMPAIVVPVGTPPGIPGALPRGVQLIGRAGDESLLLQLAAQFSSFDRV